MRLHQFPASSNARRAVMTALHLGLDVELTLVDLAKGQQRSPAYLALNPNGRVPTLEDDGFVLTESHAIMQYLCDRTPGQTLYPTELRARADVNRWLFWNAHHFGPAVGVLNFEHFVKGLMGLGSADPAEVARGERLVGQCAATLDAHLDGKTWMCGEQLSLADLALSTPLMSTRPAKLPVQQYAHLQAWFSRVQELPAWKKTSL